MVKKPIETPLQTMRRGWCTNVWVTEFFSRPHYSPLICAANRSILISSSCGKASEGSERLVSVQSLFYASSIFPKIWSFVIKQPCGRTLYYAEVRPWIWGVCPVRVCDAGCISAAEIWCAVCASLDTRSVFAMLLRHTVYIPRGQPTYGLTWSGLVAKPV